VRAPGARARRRWGRHTRESSTARGIDHGIRDRARKTRRRAASDWRRRWGAVGGGRRSLALLLSREQHTSHRVRGHVTLVEVTPGRGRNWISWRWCMREIMALDRMGKCVSLTTHSPPPATRRGCGDGGRRRPRCGGGPRPPRPPAQVTAAFLSRILTHLLGARRVFP
jgi:hypothetical protein